MKCICRRDLSSILVKECLLQSSISGGDAFILLVFNVVLTFVGGMVSVGVCVLLWVLVGGASRVDVTKMLMEAVQVTGVSSTSTNHKRQSAALLQAPDINSKVCLIVTLQDLLSWHQ